MAETPDVLTRQRQWSREPILVANFNRANIDLRLSAARARLGRVQLHDAGLSIMSGDGHAAIELGEAKAFGGLVKGKIDIRRNATGYDFQGTAALSRVDSATLLNEINRSQRLSGEADAEITLASEGETMAQLVRGLHGEMKATVANGDVAGIDLEQALRRLEKHPLSIATEVRSGRTSFDKADIWIGIDGGLATIKRADISGPGVAFSVAGSVAIPQRVLDLKLRAWQPTTAPAAKDTSRQLAMDIQGSWDDPSLLLDARNLIRRSEAAAPLWRSIGGTDALSTAMPASPGQ
jgi:AsmA protein